MDRGVADAEDTFRFSTDAHTVQMPKHQLGDLEPLWLSQLKKASQTGSNPVSRSTKYLISLTVTPEKVRCKSGANFSGVFGSERLLRCGSSKSLSNRKSKTHDSPKHDLFRVGGTKPQSRMCGGRRIYGCHTDITPVRPANVFTCG